MTQPTDIKIADAAGYRIRKGTVWGKFNHWYISHAGGCYVPITGFRTQREAEQWLRDDLAMLRRIAGLDESGNIPKDSTS